MDVPAGPAILEIVGGPLATVGAVCARETCCNFRFEPRWGLGLSTAKTTQSKTELH